MSPPPEAPAVRALRPLHGLILAFAAMVSLYAWAEFVSTFVRPGSIGPNYDAHGTDWMVLYLAGKSAAAGHLSLMFDGARLTAALNAQFAHWLSAPLVFHAWLYPPSFLLILAPLSWVGFPGSYAAFQVITAGLLVAAVLYRPDHPREAKWIALAVVVSPAAAMNAIDGQCGFLVAALLIGAFRLMPMRPLAAGVLLGIATFKPQFGLLVPVALLAMGQWRVMAAAAATVLLLGLASAAAFGADAWIVWARQTLAAYSGSDAQWGDTGRLSGDSVYACAVWLGAGAAFASLIQAGAMIAGAAATIWAYRSRMAWDIRLAVLLTATLLAAPHSANYDNSVLVVASGLWLADLYRRGAAEAAWPWTLALCLWCLTVLSPPGMFPITRLAPLLLAGFIGVLLADRRRLGEAGL